MGKIVTPRFPLGNIMIVDDEQDILEVFEELFMLWGYSLKAHSDPRKALEEIRQMPEKYQIVLVDLRMNGMDGLQLTREIHQINKGIKIILTTAYEIKDEIKEKLDTLPLQPVILGKPFGMNELRTVLESLGQQSSTKILDESG